MGIIEKIKKFFSNIFKSKNKELPSSNIIDLQLEEKNKFEESLKVNLVKEVPKVVITPICEGDGTGFETLKKY